MRDTKSLSDKLQALAARHAAVEGAFSDFAKKSTAKKHEEMVGFLEKQTTDLELLRGTHEAEVSTMAQLRFSLEESQATTSSLQAQLEGDRKTLTWAMKKIKVLEDTVV